MRFVLFSLLSVMLLLGCAHKKVRVESKISTKERDRRRTASANESITPDFKLAGKVVSVNQEFRFVVLDFPLGDMPALDQRLNVFRQGQKVGEVKISGPQIDTNIVADITAGSAQADDEVRQE